MSDEIGAAIAKRKYENRNIHVVYPEVRGRKDKFIRVGINNSIRQLVYVAIKTQLADMLDPATVTGDYSVRLNRN